MSLFDRTDALSSYNYLIRHIVPGPNNISYFIAFLLFPLALLISPSTLSHRQLYTLFLPIIYGLQLRSWWQMGGIDVISVNLTLWSFALLVLKDPRQDFIRIRIRAKPSPDRTDNKEQDTNPTTEIWEQPYPPNIQQRIPWVLTLIISIRFTNWKINDATHDSRKPTHPKTSRRAFTRSALRYIITGYILLDLTSSYTMQDPYFHASNTSIDSPLPYPFPFPIPPSSILHPLTHLLHPLKTLLQPFTTLAPRTLRTSILATQIYALIPPAFLLPTLPAIALNALGYLPDEWSPHTWPPFFGPFTAVSGYGLRGLWGRWWHQFSREVCGAVGRGVVGKREAGAREKDWMGYLIIAATTFLFSGIVHAGLIPPQPLGAEISAVKMRLCIAGFFWVQSLVFGVEVLIGRIFGWVLRRREGGHVRESLVLLWVFAWLSITLPMIVVPFRELGYWDVWPIPVSLVQGIRGRGWNRWF